MNSVHCKPNLGESFRGLFWSSVDGGSVDGGCGGGGGVARLYLLSKTR